MVRKTREQVWNELDAMGEDEVRHRLARSNAEDTELISEWLAHKARVAAELEATSQELRRRKNWVGRIPRLVGGVALVGVAALTLGLLLARRKR
jgi:radical SAM superfamily enzyme